MQQRAEALHHALQQPELDYQVVSSGAYFAYLKHPFTGESATAVAKRLVDEQHVLCLPGTTFGAGQDDYLRIAFANLEAEQMPALAQRLLESQH